MDKIVQGESKIIQTKKTVEWLVHNTHVNVFNPITFEGYQRSIDEKHCDSIVQYLSAKDFFLPTSIICASKEKYTPDLKLNIVDGQHRVQAFRVLEQRNSERYKQIKNNEISVIVLEQAEEEVEIDTFITINKTSKKVDTSLAYVLKNKINYNRASKDIGISKREYLSVELATLLNAPSQSENRVWENKISFEGMPAKQTPHLISLNAFVKSMRTFLGCLEKYHIIDLNWNNREELDKCTFAIKRIMDNLWNEIRYKWPELFDSDIEKRRIIQGSIGFSAINRFLVQCIKEKNRNMTVDELIAQIAIWIQSIQYQGWVWLPGERFSKYSSEAGFSIIAQELMDNLRIS